MQEQDSFIDGREVSRLTGLSKATRRRQIQSGRFPVPVVVGTKNLWSLREVSQAAQFAARDERQKRKAEVRPLATVAAVKS
jgi:predicted DNA-binding transcriptional regulator AlpA